MHFLVKDLFGGLFLCRYTLNLGYSFLECNMENRFFKIFAALFVLFSLQGCASVGNAVQSAIVYASQAIDESVAAAINKESGQVSLRSNSLENRPATIAAIKQACQRGRYVEVFLYQNSLSTGKDLKNSCAVVYASANANLARQEVLMQGYMMYTSGQYVAVSRQQLEQEIAFRNYLRTSSYRIN